VSSEELEVREYLYRAREVSVHIGVLFLLLASCFLILRPFVLVIAWGAIIAIAVYPGFRNLQAICGGKRILASVLATILLLALLILPVVVLGGSLVDGVQVFAARVREGTALVPPPPPGVERWPIIGGPLKEIWVLASNNLAAALKTFTPYIRTMIPGVLTASAGLAIAGVQLGLSILIAGVLLANATEASTIAFSLSNRLFGRKGEEYARLAESTVRSVTTGIIGVAFIQGVFAGITFLVFGLPGAGLWTLVFLIAALLQVGAIMLIPAVIYMFAIASTTKAVAFLVCCAVIGGMDNVLKPILLGRGAAVPIAVVFLGAIGGFLAMGIIGLFVGAVVLSVGYKLFLEWLSRTTDTTGESRP